MPGGRVPDLRRAAAAGYGVAPTLGAGGSEREWCSGGTRGRGWRGREARP